MIYRRSGWICFVAMCVATSAIFAQQREDSNEVDPALVQETTAQDLTSQLLVDVPSAYRMYWNHGLAAEDGNYLAQNAAELQTYNDLGLSYKYISETYLRKQLALPNEQGIIIVSAEESGEGYKNGFRAGDIVLQIDDESVDTQYDFVIALTKSRGSQRSAKVRRDGEVRNLVVVLSDSEVQVPQRWIIGVYVDEISAVTKAQLGIEGGAAITQLTEDGPAAKKGMVMHDIITHIDGKLINNLDELKAVVQGADGKTLALNVVRLGNNISLEIDPVQVPDVESVNVLSSGYLTRAQTLAESRTPWLSGDVPQGEYQLRFVPTIVEAATEAWLEKVDQPQSTEDRLNRLEESMKRIEDVLKDRLENK